MHPPSRARSILKWTGLVLSILILATWIVSYWFWLSFAPSTHSNIRIWQGEIVVKTWSPPGFILSPSTIGGEPDLPLPDLYDDSTKIPLWLVLIVVAIPTAWLWHRDRRRARPGHCVRCGYDLTGNTSGICSECGERRPNAAGIDAHGSIEANG